MAHQHPRQRQRPALFAPLARIALLGAALVLTGCASVSPDGLRSDVAALTTSRMADVDAALPAANAAARADAAEAIARWLAEPLTQDAAVRIALLNNPGLQARLAALGVADAERVQALTLPNPLLTLGRFVSGHEREIERSLGFNLLELITLRWRTEQQAGRMQIATLEAAQQVLALAADTRRAWLRAVAAAQIAATHERLYAAAEAGAELAHRMARVGNWNRLQLAREQALLHATDAQWARARLAAALAREQLDQQLGLWGSGAQYQLAQQLPPLPEAALPADGLEARALRERLDVQAARHSFELEAERQGYARAGALFGDLGLAYSRNTGTDVKSGHAEVRRGWELDLPLPLFDWGGAASARARALVQQSAAQLQQSALRARGQVRAAWLVYSGALELARQQRDLVLPLRQRMTDETTLRYNGMLASVWDLLAQAREGTQAVADALAAQRDFWLAETDLQQALTGAAPGSPGPLQGLPGPSTPPNNANPEPQGH